MAFFLKRSQTLRLRDLQATILGVPVVDCRFGYAVAPGHLARLGTGLGPLQHAKDLLFRESQLLLRTSFHQVGFLLCVEENQGSRQAKAIQNVP